MEHELLQKDIGKITRFEVIDGTGRGLVRRNISLDLSVQDEGRTLKIFINDGTTAPIEVEEEDCGGCGRPNSWCTCCGRCFSTAYECTCNI